MFNVELVTRKASTRQSFVGPRHCVNILIRNNSIYYSMSQGVTFGHFTMLPSVKQL